MSLNLEERLEDILKTEISSSLYCVNSELVVAMLGDMVDIFTYIVFIDNLYQYTNISPYHHITISPHHHITISTYSYCLMFGCSRPKPLFLSSAFR